MPLHAARHGGKLPAKLDDVVVRLPADPFTGKPFDYRAEGNRATLTALTPTGERANPYNTIRYELTMRPTKGE